MPKPTVSFSWDKVQRDDAGKVLAHCRNYLYLNITIKNIPSDSVASDIADAFEHELNQMELPYEAELLRCPTYEPKDAEYFDCFAFERLEGYVAEQKQSIMRVIKEVKPSVMRLAGERNGQ